jgi:hypothetical protein
MSDENSTLKKELHEAKWATLAKGDSRNKSKVKLSGQSKIGRFLKSELQNRSLRDRAWSWLDANLSEPEYQQLITSLINTLRDYGYLILNPILIPL